MATDLLHPRADGGGSLGTASYRYANLFLSGSLTDGTNSKTVAQIVAHIDGDHPHVGHVDKAGDTLTGELVVEDVTVQDGFKIYGNTAKTAWIQFVDDSSGGRWEFWNLDKHSGDPILEV
jgi:hypothetical protein